MYITENYYFKNNLVSLEQAIFTTTQTCGQWCDWYESKQFRSNTGEVETKNGELVGTGTDRERTIYELLQWFKSSPDYPVLFSLHMGRGNDHTKPIFQHHDDTCCWYLHVSEKQFDELRHAWSQANLPTDLFYQESNALRILKPRGFINKILSIIGLGWESYELYSPKEWEVELAKRPASIEKLSRNVPLW